MISQVRIAVEGDHIGEAASLIITGPNQDAGLTLSERTQLRALLVKLRDAGLAKLGYVDTP